MHEAYDGSTLRSILSRSLLPCVQQQVFELAVGIEVIFDGALGRAGDEHQAPRAGRQRLFHRVLDERLVDDRQHFLRAGLGRGQEPGTAPGDGKYGDVDTALLQLGRHGGSGPLGAETYHAPPGLPCRAPVRENARVCATSRLRAIVGTGLRGRLRRVWRAGAARPLAPRPALSAPNRMSERFLSMSFCVMPSTMAS